jgi:hypothetical protein
MFRKKKPLPFKIATTRYDLRNWYIEYHPESKKPYRARLNYINRISIETYDRYSTTPLDKIEKGECFRTYEAAKDYIDKELQSLDK